MKAKFKIWLRAALIRAVRTVCQTAVAAVGTAALFSEIHWPTVLSASLLAGLLSLLTSAAGLPEVKNGTGNDGYDGENGI